MAFAPAAGDGIAVAGMDRIVVAVAAAGGIPVVGIADHLDSTLPAAADDDGDEEEADEHHCLAVHRTCSQAVPRAFLPVGTR